MDDDRSPGIYYYLTSPLPTQRRRQSDITRSALRTSYKQSYDNISLFALLYNVDIHSTSEDNQPESEHHSPIIQQPRFDEQPAIVPIVPPVDPAVQARTIRYGLLNLWRQPFAAAPTRDAEAAAALRLNMANLYIKFVILALLYLLTAYLLWLALSVCFQIPAIILVPLTIITALHLAARRMHQPDHALHEENGYGYHSLTGPYEFVSNANIIIDRIANYSVGFFSGFARRLAHTTALDNQITYVPG